MAGPPIDSIHLNLLFYGRVDPHALGMVARESGMSEASSLLRDAGTGRECNDINDLGR